jgi:two-component system nitrate/nitrite response regulator NarL
VQIHLWGLPMSMAGATRPPLVGVVIVGKVRVYCESLAGALRSIEGVEVLGTAAEWGEIFRQFQHRRPDMVLVDAGLIAAGRGARLFAQTTPEVRLVAIAVDEDELAVLRCLEAGVSAYVRRDAQLPELVETIQRAAGGELLCSPRIAGTLGRRLSALAAEREPSNAVARLSARELEIVHLIEQPGNSRRNVRDERPRGSVTGGRHLPGTPFRNRRWPSRRTKIPARHRGPRIEGLPENPAFPHGWLTVSSPRHH